VTWVKWKLVSVYPKTVFISAQDRCRFASDVPQGFKSFWSHLMELLGDMGQVEARFSLFGDSVNLGVR
jgi:hypothetical protein